MSSKEILKLLEENNISWDNIGYNDVDWGSLNIGDVELVDEYGGENKGSEYYKIYYFKEHNVYLKIEGYYSSYSGTEFDSPPFEVKPVTKQVIVYE